MPLDAPFPLTPALSPRRGRTFGATKSHRLVRFPPQSKRAPSPWGEGRGEGDRDVRTELIRLRQDSRQHLYPNSFRRFANSGSMGCSADSSPGGGSGGVSAGAVSSLRVASNLSSSGSLAGVSAAGSVSAGASVGSVGVSSAAGSVASSVFSSASSGSGAASSSSAGGA